MFEEYEKKKKSQISSMKAVLDYGMGILILIAGIFFLFRDKIGGDSFNRRFPPNDMDTVFGIMCLVYGAWRIYRGYKKNYFR
jgi:hypothetical protein